MKNTGVLILLWFLFSTNLFCQEESIEFGLFFGPNHFLTRGNDIVDQFHKPTISYATGLFAKYNKWNDVSMRLGVQFEKNRIWLYDDSEPEDYKNFGKTNYDYLRFPITCQYSFGKNNWFFITTGLYMGVLLEVTETIFETYNSPVLVYEDNSYQKIDMGVIGGVGTKFNLSKDIVITFCAKNNLGLLNLIDNSVSTENSLKVNAIIFEFGLSYKVSKINSNIID